MTTLVALIHADQPGSAIPRSDVVGAEGGMTFGLAKELFEQARHSLAATIKQRRRDAGDEYLCSGCARCDAMYDPYELADMLDGRAGPGRDRLVAGARGSRTIAERAMLIEPAQTSGFDED